MVIDHYRSTPMNFPSNKNSITLIGMAGAGKSFMGRHLAKELGWQFIDTDDLIEQNAQKGLQEILDALGDEEFIKLEAKTILGLKDIRFKIISPGGSICYSDQAMKFLKENSLVIYLADSYSRIINRIRNLNSRGIVGLKNKSFEQLYKERAALYQKYADFTIDMSAMPTADKWKKFQEVKSRILEAVKATHEIGTR